MFLQDEEVETENGQSPYIKDRNKAHEATINYKSNFIKELGTLGNQRLELFYRKKLLLLFNLKMNDLVLFVAI